jgi:SAM-dependent methyltransferase
MSRPQRVVSDSATAAAIVERFSKSERFLGASYATVRDYCESRDELPQITAIDGDLKNVQRPWAVKAILANLRPPARLLEIGGGEPIASGFLSELGYDVTLVDPYDGFGNGPVDYQGYVERFPHVKIVREYFRPGMTALASGLFDVIFSVSVLEHIESSLGACFEGIAEFLRPEGFSIHCFDFILQGRGELDDLPVAQRILAEQARLARELSEPSLESLLEQLRGDVETFFLSPQGHHHWRRGQPYGDFPYRKVVSLQTVAHRAL